MQVLNGEPVGHAGQYLSFLVGDEYYAVDILRVREIRGWEPVRELPDTAAYVKGVLDLRGVMVPIIDLRVRFRMAEPSYAKTTVVIVMNICDPDGTTHVIGAVVDAVSDVLDFKADEVRPAPKLGTNIAAEYLSGMVTMEGRMVVMLDIDHLFNSQELAALEELAE